ncbi:MAG: putative metalloprotease CJM1_0395 family protein [Spirochaetales bacterium]|nr:putative metalloprotease CJM1_0395 family protein [Spirochaetales bacterium]
MRVIYKHNGLQPPLSPRPSSGTGRSGESVIVISSEKQTQPTRKEGLNFSGDGYDVKISDEALRRNAEVKRHEKAHMAVLGSAASSGIMYNTVKGPGGESIAVGGKIAVDLSAEPGNPHGTLNKAHTIIAAALAPASPSGPDMRMAAQAYGLARQAQEELDLQRTEGSVDLLA